MQAENTAPFPLLRQNFFFFLNLLREESQQHSTPRPITQAFTVFVVMSPVRKNDGRKGGGGSLTHA